MQNKKHTKKIWLMLVFLCSFVFQTAYAISFNVQQIQSSDLHQKHISKAAAKEEISETSFIEEETENDNEFHHELFAFKLPSLYFQWAHTSEKGNTGKKKNSDIPPEFDIFITIHNLRI